METDLSLNLNLKDTELTLGLPGTHSTDSSNESESPPTTTTAAPTTTTTTTRPQKRPAPPTSAGSDPPSQPKAQVVGWPPIRSYRKNNLQPNHQVNKKKEETSTVESNTNINTNLEESAAVQNYVKVSMDGAPFLRKIDLNGYKGGYPDLLKGLETMFKFTVGQYSEREGYKGSEFVPTYEDKDGDWMLVGDVPWEMFLSTCKRLRIMKGSEAKGLGCV